MGQRLVINIISNDEILASGYYHWSAYTESAADLTKQIIKDIFQSEEDAIHLSFIHNKEDAKKTLKLAAYLVLEYTGAGIDISVPGEEEELKSLNDGFNYRIGKNRSYGLIALTNTGIATYNNIAENTVNIDVSKDTVEFNALYTLSENEIKEFIEDDVADEEEIKELDFEFIDRFSFDQIDVWYDKIKELCSDKSYPFYKDKNEPIYYQVIA